MPPKSLNKVQKQVSKKKGRTAGLHTNSRDSQRLRRAAGRDEKLYKLAASRAKANEPYLDRLLFFQQEIQDRIGALKIEEIFKLIHSYIHRNDNELDLLQAEKRHGRPSSKREDTILQQQKKETAELRSGFWSPDFQDEANLEAFKDWTGEWVALGKLKFSRIKDDGSIAEGKFPPGRGE